MWDDFVSWNSWAISLTKGIIPNNTHHYPQAVPAAWSLAYILYGGLPLEFLPKAIMPVFLYGLCAVLAEDGAIKKSYGYLVAALLIFIFFNQTNYVYSGLVDIPVAMTIFTAFLLLIDAVEKNDRSLLIICAIVIFSSTLIKQAGIFYAILYPAIAILLMKDNYKEKLKYAAVMFFFALLIIVPFYLWAEINIALKINTSEVSWVTNTIYGGTPVLSRFLNGMKMFFSDRKFVLLLCFPFILLPNTKTIKIFAFIGYLYLCIWACFLSYDIRNGISSWSFIILSTSLSVEFFIRKYYDFFVNLIKLVIKQKKIILLSLLFVILASSILLSIKFNKSYFLLKQNKEKNLRGGPAADFINRYIEENGMSGFFLSNFQPLDFLSDDSLAKEHYFFWHFNTKIKFD